MNWTATAVAANLAKIFGLFIVFGENQSAVLDLADWIAHGPCTEPYFPDSFSSKALNFYPAPRVYGLIRGWLTSLSN